MPKHLKAHKGLNKIWGHNVMLLAPEKLDMGSKKGDAGVTITNDEFQASLGDLHNKVMNMIAKQMQALQSDLACGLPEVTKEIQALGESGNQRGLQHYDESRLQKLHDFQAK
ncbi:hypothetical protein NDU88_007875 [Pleurodeles waltl]|uniref:Uncharacterized protein n=1 Tax=Pleurodeles waltl TaxID=8319 RepID=A0AAV7RUG9_PLEWA|nr:hypothetical protein NDU88_007875 [Pleurodeles waltl]